MNLARLESIVATLAAEGLRPVIDRDLHLVRADCPACHAGENDPIGLWRPLEVIPRRERTIAICAACGGHHDV
jgi:Zn ribbon nucleic-acid-binding protein